MPENRGPQIIVRNDFNFRLERRGDAIVATDLDFGTTRTWTPDELKGIINDLTHALKMLKDPPVAATDACEKTTTPCGWMGCEVCYG